MAKQLPHLFLPKRALTLETWSKPAGGSWTASSGPPFGFAFSTRRERRGRSQHQWLLPSGLIQPTELNRTSGDRKRVLIRPLTDFKRYGKPQWKSRQPNRNQWRKVNRALWNGEFKGAQDKVWVRSSASYFSAGSSDFFLFLLCEALKLDTDDLTQQVDDGPVGLYRLATPDAEQADLIGTLLVVKSRDKAIESWSLEEPAGASDYYAFGPHPSYPNFQVGEKLSLCDYLEKNRRRRSRTAFDSVVFADLYDSDSGLP